MAQPAAEAVPTAADGVDTAPQGLDGAPVAKEPKNYVQFWAKTEDVMNQRHDRLHSRHVVGDPQVLHTAEELYTLAVTSSNIIPK